MTEEEQRYITDYLSGNLAPEERKRFSEWLAERPERQEAFREMGRTVLRARWSGRWAQTDAVKAFARVQKRLHARRLYRRMVQYAAVVLVAATAGIFLLWQEGTPTETPLVSTLPHPDNHRPVLTLHNGQSIVLSNEPQQVIAGTPAIDIRQTDSARLEYTPVSDTMDSEIHYNTLSVPKGCEFSLALADGTRIWVNAGSTLRYPERFAPGKREVFLSGEAYFEVARDTANPFFVKTD
ncbi:MAG TPA: FecR domain-containing protein, partial [Candidatus Odoribacter faecigallinarum]|nr:FecR domain-containing protein [Candidatus Odoribacter faecigallinarum]